MKSWTWLRCLSLLLVVFAVGHTLGTAAPRVTRGPQEATLFETMQSFRFPVMGFERSYWDFYRGFALTIGLQLLLMAAIAWQLSGVSRSSPRQALPMAITLLLGCVSLLVLGWTFFFAGPVVLSAIAILCSTMAVVTLAREARGLESARH